MLRDHLPLMLSYLVHYERHCTFTHVRQTEVTSNMPRTQYASCSIAIERNCNYNPVKSTVVGRMFRRSGALDYGGYAYDSSDTELDTELDTDDDIGDDIATPSSARARVRAPAGTCTDVGYQSGSSSSTTGDEEAPRVEREPFRLESNVEFGSPCTLGLSAKDVAQGKYVSLRKI